MIKNIMDYPYDIKTIILDKESINLIDLPNQRQIRGNQVNSILRRLRQGEHFDSMFVVNVNNGTKRIRVIDGGHRTTALKKFFEEQPDKKIKVSMVVYKDLLPEDERKIYTKWNLGVKQSIDDFINSYKIEIPEFESILEELPVSVYGSKNKMRLRYIVSAYFVSKQNNFVGVNHLTPFQFIEQMKKLTYDDVESMKNTFGIISEIFNPDDFIDFTRLSAFKYCIFVPLFHLVANNKIMLGRNYVVKRMKTVLNKKSELDSFKMQGRQGMVEAYVRCKSLLNDGVDHKFR